MDAVSNFPDDPMTKFHAKTDKLSIQSGGRTSLAGVHLRFSDHKLSAFGRVARRDELHWSFFFNSTRLSWKATASEISVAQLQNGRRRGS